MSNITDADKEVTKEIPPPDPTPYVFIPLHTKGDKGAILKGDMALWTPLYPGVCLMF